jgi:phosphopantothenoylcysteine decarboxylase/phosphopantothenate--cysteine ligase
VLRRGEAIFLFGARPSDACSLEGDHARLVDAVLDAAIAPATREDIVARILSEAAADASQRGAVDTAIDLLLRLGALVPRGGEAPVEPVAAPGGRVLVGVTGAIGAIHAPILVERLVAAGHDVRVAMTSSSRRFIRPRSFEAITHQPASLGMWEGTPRRPAPHIELARWADVVVLYPCSATTLGRLASGDCAELVSAVATTTRAPVLLAPSMNVEMLRAPAVADNLARLLDRGFYVADGGMGMEVADAPRHRLPRSGVAAPAQHVVRYVGWLLERAMGPEPRVLSRAEWDEELDRQGMHGATEGMDDDLARALAAHASPPARVLEVGTGLGAIGRAVARLGHVVVATDFSRRAIDRASVVDRSAPVTWIVDDVTEPSVVGSFDVCIDRGCLGSVPIARRQRYASAVASLVRPTGVLLLKVHLAPARQIRAHGFRQEDILELLAPWFEPIAVSESRLSFGEIKGGPALLFELRRRA